MRKAFSEQQRLDCRGVAAVQFNLNCRDEIIPVLRALQQIYSRPELRESILDLVAEDVNRDARDDVGREGMDYWQILVLAAVRLGCNLDYDKLQNLAEEHRALRQIMGIGDWDDRSDFSWRRIRDNVCLLSPATIEKIIGLRVQIAPMTKIGGFLCDAYYAEWTYGKLQVVKKAMAAALAHLVEAGYYEEHELPAILRQVLHDTPRDLYDLAPRA